MPLVVMTEGRHRWGVLPVVVTVERNRWAVILVVVIVGRIRWGVLLVAVAERRVRWVVLLVTSSGGHAAMMVVDQSFSLFPGVGHVGSFFYDYS